MSLEKPGTHWPEDVIPNSLRILCGSSPCTTPTAGQTRGPTGTPTTPRRRGTCTARGAVTHASLRRHARTSAHGEWYAPEWSIFTLLPSTKHGQNAAAQHKSHPPRPRRWGRGPAYTEGCRSHPWSVAERKRPSWTLPFLSTGGRGRTSSRCPGGHASRSRRNRKGVTRAEVRLRQRAGRRLFRWRRRSLGRRDRRDRLAARDDGGCRLDENARNAVRVVRVRRGLRGEGGHRRQTPSCQISSSRLSCTRKSVSSLAMNAAASRFDASLRAACSCARRLPRPGCRARRRAWFSRGRTRKARSPTTTSGWMTSRTRLAPGTPRARRRRGVVPGFALGDASRVPGAAGSRTGDAATFAESAAVTGALDAPGIPRTQLETVPDGGATGDASATTRHPPSHVLHPPEDAAERSGDRRAPSRRAAARVDASTRAREERLAKTASAASELSRRKHVAGKGNWARLSWSPRARRFRRRR